MTAHHHDLALAAWRKSTYSSQDGNCVEIAANLPGIVAVRDSKNPPGPVLTFTHSDWAAFIQEIKTGGAFVSGESCR